MQGIIKILDTTNLDPDLLNWFAVNLSDLIVEVNVILDGLQFTDYEDYIALTGYTQNTTGLIAIPTAINADLTPENNIIFGIDGWKPVTKIWQGLFYQIKYSQVFNYHNSKPNWQEYISKVLIGSLKEGLSETRYGWYDMLEISAALVILNRWKTGRMEYSWNSVIQLITMGRVLPTLFTFNVKGMLCNQFPQDI